jgi:hypothetical protein
MLGFICSCALGFYGKFCELSKQATYITIQHTLLTRNDE